MIQLSSAGKRFDPTLLFEDLDWLTTPRARVGLVGGCMFTESLQALRRGVLITRRPVLPKGESYLSRLPFQVDFQRSHVCHSVLLPFFLGAVVGSPAAIMGVGGGFLMVPMMVYPLGMPMHVAVGSDLFQILHPPANRGSAEPWPIAGKVPESTPWWRIATSVEKRSLCGSFFP